MPTRTNHSRRSPRIVLIDHEDSFTHNLAQQMGSLGACVTILPYSELHQDSLKGNDFDAIVLSPGPGNPAQRPKTLKLIRSFAPRVPLLGVCLGHQCLAHVFAGKQAVVHAPAPMHGKASLVYHDQQSIMQQLPSPFAAARYHSLIVKTLSPDFSLMCWSGTQKKPKLIMGMHHKNLPVFGVQFHPESFLTEHGSPLMQNFLSIIK